MKLFNFIKIALLTMCVYHAQAASSDGPKPASGIDPIDLHGFRAVHETGITGKGTRIVFIETMGGISAVRLPEALQLKKDGGAICVYDCSHEPVLPGAEDKSVLRMSVESRIEDAFAPPAEQCLEGTYHSHEIQTASLALGTRGAAPGSSYLGIHHGIRYASGVLDFSIYTRSGAAIYSYMDLVRRSTEQKIHQFYYRGDASLRLINIERNIGQLEPGVRTYLTERPVDSSILDAIRIGASTPKCIINMSIDLTSLTDPFDSFKVPVATLDAIASQVESSDSILILAATNLADGGISKKERVDGYLRSLAQHAVLGPRTLIAINVESQSSGADFKTPVMLAKDIGPNKITLPNGMTTFLRLFHDTNLPGEGGWEKSAICALGANIVFPNGITSNGTSLSAPIIAGLAALIQEKYPALSGPEVVQRIKDTAIKLGDAKIYGNGLINPLAAVR